MLMAFLNLLKLPLTTYPTVHASDIHIVFDKWQPNFSSFTLQKQKLYFYMFTFQVKALIYF